MPISGLALALDAQGALREDLPPGDVGDDRRRPGRRADGRGPGDRLGGPGLPGRDPPPRPRPAYPHRGCGDRRGDAGLRAEPGSVLASCRARPRSAAPPSASPSVSRCPRGRPRPALRRPRPGRAGPGVRRARRGAARWCSPPRSPRDSLTIEGVRVLVDSGLARVPVYEPDLGLTRLVTQRASRASVDQRRGRAGRTQPGVCYRLWSEAATGALDPFTRPEILAADLAGLVLDAPPGACRPDDAPLPRPAPRPGAGRGPGDAGQPRRPRRRRPPDRCGPGAPRPAPAAALARMVVSAAARGRDAARDAADLAAVLVERGLGGDSVDLAERAERFRRDRSTRAEDMRRLAAGWAKIALAHASPPAARRPARSRHPPGAGLSRPDRPGPGQGRRVRPAGERPRRRPRSRRPALARERSWRWPRSSARPRRPHPGRGGDRASRHRGAVCRPDRGRTRVEFDRDRGPQGPGAAPPRRGLARRTDLPVPTDADRAAILARGLAGLGVGALPWSKARSNGASG